MVHCAMLVPGGTSLPASPSPSNSTPGSRHGISKSGKGELRKFSNTKRLKYAAVGHIV